MWHRSPHLTYAISGVGSLTQIMVKDILCISNGHGEDRIAAYICRELLTLGVKVQALPLVGAGHSYGSLQIPLIINNEQNLPTGGFARSSAQALWQDIRGGLLVTTRQQWRLIKQWVTQHPQGLVLAVGDIVPLAMAWFSGAKYSFVATAKSEYYWRDSIGKLRGVPTPLGGSYFYPWERWLMHRSRCLANFVRDELTRDYLHRYFNLPVSYCGNPMMDGLAPQGIDLPIPADEWTIVILPGSRPPESYHNWQTLLVCAQVALRFLPHKVHFLAAIAPSLDISTLEAILLQKGWLKTRDNHFKLGNGELYLVANGFADCLQRAHLGLAMAGTATEQMVGLAKPVITIAGTGPQFTKKFALEQKHLLGCAINLIDKPAQTAEVLEWMLGSADYFQLLVKNAQERMGASGASAQIAQRLAKLSLP
jgi:uncharacterized protein (TIGR03492 family)